MRKIFLKKDKGGGGGSSAKSNWSTQESKNFRTT